MKPEQLFKPTQPNELTDEQLSAADSILAGRNFIIEDPSNKSEAEPTTEPVEFKMTSPWEEANAALDSQLEAADSILDGAKARPVTPGKTDEFKLPKIPVQPGTKPRMNQEVPTNNMSDRPLDSEGLLYPEEPKTPRERELARMREREAQKNKGGLFNKIKGLFGGS